MQKQLGAIIDNLRALGPRRLAALGGALALVVAIVGLAAYFLNRPAFEVLYVGLDRADASRIALALGEAGIAYEVGSDGASVSAETGRLAQARMILAEKGLPGSAGAGYELFDDLGSLGLTSFMQEVTRLRALEGEIARSIVAINGVRSARVHIVLAEQGSFRRNEAKPTASVIVRSNGADLTRAATAIRHLVAAAVPGLSTESVTVLDASGQVLAAGDDPASGAASAILGVQQVVESEIAAKIARTLAPHLGADNFQASVRADINADQRQVEETTFDPESRVERSVQVVRAEDTSSETAAAEPATVEQNLPEAVEGDATQPQSAERSERREETTNYEINSRCVATVSNGYRVERLSISVVVNADRLAALAGAGADAAAIAAQLEQIKAVAAAAAGLDEGRGDRISVVSAAFLDAGEQGMVSTSVVDRMLDHAGTTINALAFLGVAGLLIAFGLRPLVRVLAAADAPDQEEAPLNDGDQAAAGAGAVNENVSGVGGVQARSVRVLLDRAESPQDRLAAIVDLDEQRSAEVLRRWIHEAAA